MATTASKRTRRGQGRWSNQEKILEAAELEFSKHGYEACSLRMIAKSSGANLGLLHYYFGSKELLFSAVFLRRANVLVHRRLALLSEARLRHGDKPIPVDELIRCFVMPTVEMIKMGNGPRAFISIHVRLRSESLRFGRKLRGMAFNEANNEFIREFRRSCPHLSPAAVVWRQSAMIGAYYSLVSQSGPVHKSSKWQSFDPNDVDTAIEHLMPFLVGGFLAADQEVKPRKRAPAR